MSSRSLPFSLQIATPRDAETLAQMSRELIEHGLHWRYRKPQILALMRDPDTTVLTARNSRGIVGFAVMRFGQSVAHLVLIAVAQNYQRHGIGQLLLAWLSESAAVAGVERLVLEVRARNDQARAFYRNLGFSEHFYLERYYDQQEGAFQMTCHLRDLAIIH